MISKISESIIPKIRNRHFLFLDIFILAVSPVFTLYLRLDGEINLSQYGPAILSSTVLFATITLSVFYLMDIYRKLWNKASIDELAQIAAVGIDIILLQSLAFTLLKGDKSQYLQFYKLPSLFPFYEGGITILLAAASRFSLRFFERIGERFSYSDSTSCSNTLIIGAGAAGVEIVQELQRNRRLRLIPSAYIDDDKSKHGLIIRGIEVKGDRRQIPELIKSLDIKKVLIAMPTAPGSVIREIAAICKDSGVETLIIPGIYEIVAGRVRVEHIRKVEIEDLLRRETIQTDIEGVEGFIKGKKVLVTGAGGSIGSELCRQVLNCFPAKLLLLGHGENSIFEIEQELRLKLKQMDGDGKGTELDCKIADLRFRDRLQYLISGFRPDVIFHAAAHKHVPLMESNPAEAITNNVLGTRNLVELAVENDVNHFVLISTDKAVNPTSIMGSSKRLAEMIVLNSAQQTGRSYSVVRFGNVLGSRGSVVRTFKKQIENGGPVTITHPDITRYFITIPEAVQLVLQASVLGKGGEIFILDMGKPVRVIDLARDLITLSGLEVGRDIEIVFTGLRPGEKLYEELFIAGEDYRRTVHEKIFIAGNSTHLIAEDLNARLEALISTAAQNDYEKILLQLMNLLPEFTPDPKHIERLAGTGTPQQFFKDKERNNSPGMKVKESLHQTGGLVKKSGRRTEPLENGPDRPEDLL